MHLHVKILPGTSTSPCELCSEPAPVNGSWAILHIFAGSGNDVAGPYCDVCWEKVQIEGLELSVPQAAVDKGGPPNRRDKKRSQKQELKIAKDIGGRVQKGSGSQPHAKGDVRVKGKFRVEAKFTRAKSYYLTREVLDKISSECHGSEKPVLQLDFLNPSTLRTEGSWVVIPYEDWMEQIDETS